MKILFILVSMELRQRFDKSNEMAADASLLDTAAKGNTIRLFTSSSSCYDNDPLFHLHNVEGFEYTKEVSQWS